MNPIPRARRRFLRAIAAGATSAALHGCAIAPAARAPVARVVVIGGGFGGATAARYLRLWGGGTVEVVLVERDARYVSCPLSNLVIAGSRRIEDVTLGYEGLRAAGVTVLRDEARHVDAAGKQVMLASGTALRYDSLVLSPGMDYQYGEIDGYDAQARKSVLHAWKAGPDTVALRRQLEAMRDGGVVLIAIPRAPYRCPPGPYERASLIALYLKAAKPNSRVLILDANEEIVSKKGLFLAAWNELYPGLVEYRPNHEVKEVVASESSVKTDFDTFRADVLNVIPPQRAGAIAAEAGLINVNNRWCDVDWLTMESTAAAGIHVLGDATLSAPAMAKSGSMANNHAKVAAAAILDRIAGRPVNPQPVMVNACYSYLSDREAAHVASVHRYDAGRKTLMPVPGTSGVSPRRNEQEKGYADAWAKTFWADSLG